MRRVWLLAGSLAPLVLGAAAGLATRDGVLSSWYAGLRKPSWMPPAWVFGPVWTALYILMGAALWIAVSAGAPPAAMALFATQLAMNIAWSFVFFRSRSLRWSAATIVALLATVVWTTAAFFAANRLAGALLVPYVAWVGFATLLNVNLLLNNNASTHLLL